MFEGENLAKVINALKFSFKILLLPSKNEKKSLTMTIERVRAQQERNEIPNDLHDFIIETLTYPSHKKLSDIIIYVEDKTTEEIINEILEILKQTGIDVNQFKFQKKM
jgi:signal transduction histidine kinase